MAHPLPNRPVFRVGQPGILGQQRAGGLLRLAKQAHVPGQVHQLHLGQTVLAVAEKITGAPGFQVLLRDLKTVGGGGQDTQTLHRL